MFIISSNRSPEKIFTRTYRFVIISFLLLSIFSSYLNGKKEYDATLLYSVNPKNFEKTKNLLKILQEEGVSATQIIGIDESGIPMVCGSNSYKNSSIYKETHTLNSSGIREGSRSWEAIPNIIRTDGIDSFRLEVNTNGPVQRVSIEPLPLLKFDSVENLDLHDDGFGEDRIAGDNVFTTDLIRFNTNSLLSRYLYYDSGSPESLFIVDITIKIVEEDGSDFYFLIFPQVGLLNASIPKTDIIQLSPNVSISSHIINVRTNSRITQSALRYSFGLTTEIGNKIYEVMPDIYDFLLQFSTDHIEITTPPINRNFVAGAYQQVKIDFTGTGKGIVDASIFYGSNGKLLGIGVLDTLSRGIKANNATHEIVHQWSAFIDSSFDVTDGAGHLDTKTNVPSIVGGYEWLDNGDGSYTVNRDEGRSGGFHASLFDKYMMGLIPSDLFPTILKYSGPFKFSEPILNEEITNRVSIEDIISIHGNRIPGPDTAKRNFTIGFVAESYERMLTSTEMTFYNILAKYFTKELAPESQDPYVAFNWQPISRYFGEGTKWTTNLSGFDLDNDHLPDYWEMKYFNNLEAISQDDSDNDGLNNIIEYALGSNPKLPDRENSANITINENNLEFHYNKIRPDINYTVEVSDDLINWTSSGVNQGGIDSNAIALIPIVSSDKLFIRLKVSGE